jgi:hypothetical protein
MSPLLRWFGPSREEIWRQLSGEIAAQYVDGGFWKGDRVEARHEQWTVTLDTYQVSNGKQTTTYTRMRAPYVNPSGFRFTIYRKGFFSDIAKWLGMQDVRVGHEPFDTDFIIKGTSELRLTELFSNDRIRELISQQPHIHFTVKDDEGWFGPKFVTASGENVDELRFTCLGVIKDVARLKTLFALFAETLEQLCRMGAAYDSDPAVKV